MLKILLSFILLLLGSNLFAFSDGSWVAVSSNSFGRVEIGSVTTVVIPTTSTVLNDVGSLNHVAFSTWNMREVVYANMSSSATVLFSTSSNASWTRDYGFPLFPREILTMPFDPAFYFSTNSATRMFFVREAITAAGGGYTPVRVWVRHSVQGKQSSAD